MLDEGDKKAPEAPDTMDIRLFKNYDGRLALNLVKGESMNPLTFARLKLNLKKFI